MEDISSSIFKKYDIRGLATGEDATLTMVAAHAVGQAFGTYLQRFHQISTCIVGRDNRSTSYDLQSTLTEGLRRSGVSVIDIGLVSTPIVYWHAVRQNNCGGVMVTGSHLPPEYNGFKMSLGGKTIFGSDIKLLHRLITNNQFIFGRGDSTTNHSSYSQYVNDLQGRLKLEKRFKVVFDPGNGTAGIFIPRLLQLWGQDAVGINIEPDGTYPNHQPDPQKAENMQQLGDKVREIGADIGFGYDGDADRVGVVDENGDLIPADRILALLAKDMLTRHRGAAVVADVLSSQSLFDAVRLAGGVPYMAASGHSLVKEEMRERKALLGGEMSGHMFFAEDYYGFDDAYLATGRILQMLTNAGKPLSELNVELPEYYSTPEYRPHCPDVDKDDVIYGMEQQMREAGYNLVTVDGVRVQFDNGWGIVRKSNTEPVLSLRFEGKTEEDAIKYRNIFALALRNYPQVEKIT